MQNKNWKTRKVLLYFGAALLVLTFAFTGFTYYQLTDTANHSYQELERSGNISLKRKQAVTLGEDPISILLMGIEDYSSGGQDGRADTQIVLTLNPSKGTMTMTTVPRDTRVKITRLNEFNGYHKINASYAFGSISNYGAEKLTVESVEKLLDIPVDKYISVNFDGFRTIVDTLGGVSIDIKEPFWEKNIYDNNKRIYFDDGVQHLNGEEALAFVRMRKRSINATYSREERQRQFIKAMVNQAVSAKTIFKMEEVKEIIENNIKTNLKPKEIYALQRAYSAIDSSEIKTLNIKGSNQLINGLSYFIPDENSLKEVSQHIKLELEIDQGKHIDFVNNEPNNKSTGVSEQS